MRTNAVINQEVFNKAVVAELEKVYADGYRIQINEIIKNNDTTLYGLTIMEGNISISPSIYLNEYFEVYKDGRTMNGIVNELIEIYENNKRPNIETAVTDIVDFDKVKNKIVIKLVNRVNNTQFLKDTPFIPFCDLAIIFNIIVPCYDDGSATITVKNNILQDYWKLEANDLLELALENSKRLQPAKIQGMVEILREMFAKDFANQMGADSDMFSDDELDALFQEMTEGSQGVEMYVATNVNAVNGASVMLYDDLLKNFANKIGKNLFILPSSTHELILVPDTGFMNAKDIKSMVMDVNETQVAADEILSNNVYYFSLDTGSITLA